MGKISLKLVYSVSNLQYVSFYGEGNCEIGGRTVSFKKPLVFPAMTFSLKLSVFDLMGNPDRFNISLEWDEPTQLSADNK